eukprot:CCRYP_009303-RD/>CCRYP_009303-RD protein AED:0.09 eAED:0.09 QI:102/0.93/0.93/1/0.8/0.62/16/340/1751
MRRAFHAHFTFVLEVPQEAVSKLHPANNIKQSQRAAETSATPQDMAATTEVFQVYSYPPVSMNEATHNEGRDYHDGNGAHLVDQNQYPLLLQEDILDNIHYNLQQQPQLAAASFAEPYASSSSSTSSVKCSNPCTFIDIYSLQPLPETNCREYVLCQDHKETYRYTCPDEKRFDNKRKKCVNDDNVECACFHHDENNNNNIIEENGDLNDSTPTSEAEAICYKNRGRDKQLMFALNNCREFVSCRRNGSVKEIKTCPEGFLFDSILEVCNWENRVHCSSQDGGMGNDAFNFVNVGFMSFGDANERENSTPNIEEQDEEDMYALSQEDNFFICSQTAGSDFAFLPLPGCTGFVSCSEGRVVNEQSCSEGLLFDTSINGCNWDYMVDCTTTASPSHSPSLSPTLPRPTPNPTSPPNTLGPTNVPTTQPTNRPTFAPQKRTSRPTMPITYPPFSESPTSSDAFPQIMDWIRDHATQLNQHVFRSYSREGLSYRSYWFQHTDFIDALKIMSSESITGEKRHIFYLGDERREWEYGLVNVVAFLSQAMTESISKDACDEFNWEMNTDDFSKKEEGTKPNQHYAMSNSCGQGGMNYQEFHCNSEESHMECVVDRNMKIQATTSEVYPNAPPPLTCRPRTTTDSFTGFWNVMTGKESTSFPYENSYGRTDVEGCCFWGRGAIHTKGVCQLGKLNYYLGKKAATDARPSRYPNVDFCGFPEAICAGPESSEMRWVTSMFEWTERIQTYDDGKGWNYMKELKNFVDTGMYNVDFPHAVSGIVTQGCHDPPCEGASERTNGGFGSATEIHMADDRVQNFQTALVALEAGGEKALVRAVTNFFSDRKGIVNSNILQSQTPEGQLYPSYRYQLSDFLSALTSISEDGVAGKKFYVGDAAVAMGVRYGIVNAIMYLAQAYKEAIQYDACDENNWSMVNDKFPLSNSCGQLDMSYQDMHCSEDEAFMECPVQPEMEQYALTSALWFQAPGPFKCGPRSKFPTTGYWDYTLGKENNEDAYANDRGRVDVEGCCWWGRGIIQTKGVCNYGKLNYYLGARAAREGRKALYPTIDFCDFPQGVCSSDETYGGELQWMVGLFEWVDRIQSYDKGGWNYIEELKAFADGGYADFDFVDRVSSILNLGCHSPPCTGISPTAMEPHNERDRNDTFQRFLNQLQVVSNFPAPPPPTPLPTPFPTEEPSVVVPTTDPPTRPRMPTVSPTISPAPTSLAGRPPSKVATDFWERVTTSKKHVEEVLLTSEHPYGISASYIYTWKSFLISLEKMTKDEIGPGPGNWFYIGEEDTVDYGLVNLAAFLAHAVTQSIYFDACDENNWEVVDFRYPLSNSCGQGLQGGLSYQDQKCTDEDEGLECEVDPKMEIYGVTHASWIGAPQPFYCGDKSTGYWDHVTGLERNEKPFKNAAGRSDVRGCCWWGRGVLQVRGVCQYGKLNYYLGSKGAAERRKAMYPDIDFCRNPGAICSDRRAPELRWVTGMFYWANQIQRNRGDIDYLGILKDYVNGGDFEDSSFIDVLNSALGGSPNVIANRTHAFFEALKAFGLVTEDKLDDNDTIVPNYCGVDFEDASRKCSMLCVGSFLDSSCPQGETCHTNVVSCVATGTNSSGVAPLSNEQTIISSAGDPNINTGDANLNSTAGEETASAQVEMAALVSVPVTTATPMSILTNYCGTTWVSAATECSSACPSGMDIECPPGHSCFAEISTCATKKNGETSSSKWCGKDWSEASLGCLKPCPAGLDSECPPPTRCFGDVTSC